MNKKILFCINDLSLAGAENITFNVFIGLINSNKISRDSTILLLHNQIDDLFLSVIDGMGLNVYVVNKRKNRFILIDILLSIFKLFCFFKNNKYDTIYVNLFPSLFVFSILNKVKFTNKSKLIFTEHSVSNNRPKNFIYMFIEKLIYKEYDTIICISENVKSALVNRVGNISKIQIICNGLPPLLLNEFNRIDIRTELKIPSDSILLLMTSRVGDGKDHLTLLKSFELIFDDNLYLIFIGDGDFSNVINTITSEKVKNNVKLLGKRKDARLIMKEVDINILSSAYEGISGVTLEAFASNRPYLGSNVDGIRELVGTSLSLFEFGNKIDLAEKISMILNYKDISEKIVELNLIKLKEYDFNLQLTKLLEIL